MRRRSDTYTFEEGPPHIPVEEYLESCRRDYQELLSQTPSEPDLQEFLEKHPCMVPGHATPSGSTGHYPLHCSLITQPLLPTSPSFQPDFMWIATHSGSWFPTLIEIEDPKKTIFKRDHTPSQKFTQAHNQLNQWRAWFSRTGSQQVFMDYFGVNDHMRSRAMQPHMILIYGRGDEVEDQPEMVRQRGTLAPADNEDLMSFDRLTPAHDMRNAFTVKAKGSGRYEVVWVPPVFELGPDLANRLLYLDGLPEAVDKNPDISDERKAFLKTRIPYWREWARNPRGYSPRDSE